MKTRILILAILLLPALALAAGSPEPAATPACGQLAVTPAPEEAPALSPLDGAIAMSGPGCCQSLQQQCAANCRHKGGISEFNCFPESCTASCLCNVFP